MAKIKCPHCGEVNTTSAWPHPRYGVFLTQEVMDLFSVTGHRKFESVNDLWAYMWEKCDAIMRCWYCKKLFDFK